MIIVVANQWNNWTKCQMLTASRIYMYTLANSTLHVSMQGWTEMMVCFNSKPVSQFNTVTQVDICTQMPLIYK